MPMCLDPHLEILPPDQRAIWPALRVVAEEGFVLYGGTAVALHLGHRQSVDFDFFASEPLDKPRLISALPLLSSATVLSEDRRSLAVSAGGVKLSFFAGLSIGRVREPVQTRDGVLLVASPEDLLATKLKAILDRAEAKDYRDIAALLTAGLALEAGLAAAREMFRAEPRTILTAIGFFDDGDVTSVSASEKQTLLDARNRVRTLPEVVHLTRSLAVSRGDCTN